MAAPGSLCKMPDPTWKAATPPPEARRSVSRPGSAFQLVAPSQSEHELQIDCTKMLNGILLPDVAWTAIDHAHSLNMAIGRNGRPIGLIEMQKRKARGIKPGITDYLFWHLGLGFACELKTVDGVLSDDQEVFLKNLIRAKVEIRICWTIDQVFQTVVAWGLVRPGVRLT